MEGTGSTKQLIPDPKERASKQKHTPAHHDEGANEGTYNVNGNGRGGGRKAFPRYVKLKLSWKDTEDSSRKHFLQEKCGCAIHEDTIIR